MSVPMLRGTAMRLPPTWWRSPTSTASTDHAAARRKPDRAAGDDQEPAARAPVTKTVTRVRECGTDGSGRNVSAGPTFAPPHRHASTDAAGYGDAGDAGDRVGLYLVGSGHPYLVLAADSLAARLLPDRAAVTPEANQDHHQLARSNPNLCGAGS